MVEVETKQEERVKRKEEVGGLRKERGGKEFRGSGQKDGNSQVERRRKKKHFSCYLQSCLAEGAAGTAGPEF